MGKPAGKASACLRVAASAKAGATLLIEKHGRSCPLQEFTSSEIFPFPQDFKWPGVGVCNIKGYKPLRKGFGSCPPKGP
jgi:hypothetical protein